MNNQPIILIDLFSGAGGVSTGAERATVNGQKVVKVLAAVNHDEMAISSHAANHPRTAHFVEDIRTLEVSRLARLLHQAKAENPNALVILWASLECTNFSKAKGGMPRDADSRTLADHMDRYVVALKPDIFYFENVVEFMSWGPLDENGKPVSKTAGRDYILWINRITALGYVYEKRVMNSANFGAYTSRERLFGQFVRPGMPIIWPQATHSKKPVTDQFGSLAPWRPVREVLDLHDWGTSIFNRKKPLVENTLERILDGLQKFATKNDRSFLLKYNSTSANGEKKNSSASLNHPAPVVSTQGRIALVSPFMISNYGNSRSAQSCQMPAGSVTTHDRFAIINPQFISRNFSTGDNNAPISNPAGSLLANPKMNLITAFLVNPQYSSRGSSVDAPAPVVIARQDKMPLSIATTVDGPAAWTINPGDSPMTIRIKEFMQQHGIADVYYRMLHVHELKRIMGFGEHYILKGKQADQKKFIGNAVECTQAQANFEAIARYVIDMKKTA